MDKQALMKHGAISWNELMTNDINGAKSFYSALFGWDIVENKDAAMPYHMIRQNDVEIGGMMPNPTESTDVPPDWGCYITVDDVDAQLEKAQSLGAKVIMPATDIPMVGRFAVIQDPQGAMLSIITYSGECN